MPHKEPHESVSNDYLGAMPRLVGAPAYARPPRPVVIDRPFDPDDLPLEAHRTASDRAFIAALQAPSHDGDAPAEEKSFLRRALLPLSRR
jgi:hypothetical protein